MEAQISPDNPIVFVLDPTNREISVPAYIDGELIAETPTCVSVGIQPNIEGETSIEVASSLSSLQRRRLVKIHQGQIDAPGKTLAVVTAEFEEVVSTELDSDTPAFEVWVDDDASPRRVVIRLI